MANPLAASIAQKLGLAGITVTAGTLEALVAQYATIPTASIRLGAIWAASQLLAKLPSATQGLVYEGNYGSAGPQFTPPTPGALAIDLITRQQWVYAAGVWT